jgi:hypothetical protein
MMQRVLGGLVCVLLLGVAWPGQMDAQSRGGAGGSSGSLLQLLGEELEYSMRHLAADDGTKPYYISYTVTDYRHHLDDGWARCVQQDDQDHSRVMDVDLRVGDYALDSTRQIRGGAEGRFGRGFGTAGSIALENDPIAIKHTLWLATDRAFKSAVERFQRVKTDLKTTVEEESKAHDFSQEKPSVYEESDTGLTLDRVQWVPASAQCFAVGSEAHPDLRLQRLPGRAGGESDPGDQRRRPLENEHKTMASYRLGQHEGRGWNGPRA